MTVDDITRAGFFFAVEPPEMISDRFECETTGTCLTFFGFSLLVKSVTRSKNSEHGATTVPANRRYHRLPPHHVDEPKKTKNTGVLPVRLSSAD